MDKIQLIKYKFIDFYKWDTLVKKYSKGLPYAYSWYLNSVCEEWNLIIYGDYQAGFAFQVKKKFGLSYSLQPFLTQQLGFFGEDINIFSNIINKLNKTVFHYHYQLNHFNKVSNNIVSEKPNFELSLNNTWKEIFNNYKTNTKRNLKKASVNQIEIINNNQFQLEDFDFIIKNSKIDFNGIRITQFKRLMQNAHHNTALEVYRAINNNELVALVIFIKTKIRSVYLLAVTNKKGLETKANFLLVDHFIKENAQSQTILDFEGSNIEGVARFYTGFGAHKTTYQEIKKTCLKKFIIKLFN